MATIFRSAFIDAGLMTEWHDSFLSGSVENRVLAVDYGTGAYSITYYWFQFTTSGVFYSNASGWNAGSDVPSGTQYRDYFSTTTNSVSNHVELLALTTSTTVTLTRYTSGNHTFFVLRSGSSYYTFGIDHAAVSLQSWVDLNIGYHNGMVRMRGASVNSNVSTGILASIPYRNRRSFLDGSVCNGSTANFNYVAELPTAGWNFNSAASDASSNYWSNTAAMSTGLLMPFGSSAANPAFTSDYNPVYTGIRHLSVVAANLPADFGITASRTSNTNAIQDTLTVSAGVEVWEVLAFFNASNTTGAASALFLARTT